MCTYKSAWISPNGDILHCEETDSHELIARVHHIRDRDANRNLRAVRIEYSWPEKVDDLGDITRWQLTVDEDTRPHWLTNDALEAAREKLAAIVERAFISTDVGTVEGGCWILLPGGRISELIGGRIVQASPGANLCRSRLRFASLRCASFTGADFTGADLYSADLRRSKCTGADFTRADLCGADLCGADFTGADFTGANFAGANLYGADFTGANFAGADCTGAVLRGAVLSSTDFTGANFHGSDLRDANFHRADLYGADFTGADLSCADFSKANFAGAILASASWNTNLPPPSGWTRAASGTLVRDRIARP